MPQKNRTPVSGAYVLGERQNQNNEGPYMLL